MDSVVLVMDAYMQWVFRKENSVKVIYMVYVGYLDM